LTGGSTCRLHTCAERECLDPIGTWLRGARKVESTWCETHGCPFCQGPRGCSTHHCQFPGCAAPFRNGTQDCKHHACSRRDCSYPIKTENDPHCEYHSQRTPAPKLSPRVKMMLACDSAPEPSAPATLRPDLFQPARPTESGLS
jgi:hypothetical protein